MKYIILRACILENRLPVSKMFLLRRPAMLTKHSPDLLTQTITPKYTYPNKIKRKNSQIRVEIKPFRQF